MGRVQRWGGPIEESGRATWCRSQPASEALARRRADDAMSHIAITEALDGRNVDWLEKVTDEQYAR